MGSLKIFTALDKFDYSKKSNSSAISSNNFHTGRTCVVNSLSRVSNVKVNNPINDELSSSLNSESVLGETIVEQNPNHYKNPNEKKFRGSKKESKRIEGSRVFLRRTKWERELESLFSNAADFDVDYSAIRSEMSLEQCNSVLKRLESSFSDDKALRFFDWMRSNKKLEGNIRAYNSVFRVLGRRQDWVEAEKMIRELKDESGCEPNCQIFNTLIFSCAKLGRVESASKWLRTMLENGVEPNEATFGMVMGLYRKSWSLDDAEFAFSRMRESGVLCRSAYSAMITIYTRSNLHAKAEDVIGFLREDKVTPDLDNWLAILNAYSQQGKLEDAELILSSMQKAGFSPNIVAYNTLITGYGKASKMDNARRVFECIENVGLEPDETSYRSMIEGWGRAENYDEARRCYERLKELGHKPNSSNLHTMINLVAKFGDEEEASRTIGDMLELGCQCSSTLGIVLQAYERAGRVEKLPTILKGRLYSHVLADQTSCSIVAMAYAKRGLVGEAIRVLREKAWNDLGFEENLYHILICSCKDSGRLENAVKIYSHMPKRKDKKPNVHITCTMIDIYGSLGEFREAERLYSGLRSSGVALDMIGYTIVVRMYVKSGSLDEACSVLDTMEKQNDVTPDIHLLRDMFRLYQRCERLSELSKLYYKALKIGPAWDRETYNCVLNCCARALPVDEISRIFNEMVRRGFVPNTVTLNVLLDLYGKSKLFRRAEKLLWMAQKWGLVDVISYNTLISAYGRNNELKRMSSKAKQMQFKGFSVSLEAYNSMLDAYGKGNQMERFKGVLQRMKESKCVSDRYTYNILINIYGEQGWIDEVSEVLADLKECGVGPDVYSYNTLIKAYGIAGMVEEAVGLVKEMRENEIEPDKITYVNLITALRRNDEFLEAVKWSLWMKQMGL